MSVYKIDRGKLIKAGRRIGKQWTTMDEFLRQVRVQKSKEFHRKMDKAVRETLMAVK